MGVSDISVNSIEKGKLFSSCFDGNIYNFNYEKLVLETILKGHTAGVWTLDHSKNEGLLISGGNDNTINLWDTKTNRLIESLNEHDQAVFENLNKHIDL